MYKARNLFVSTLTALAFTTSAHAWELSEEDTLETEGQARFFDATTDHTSAPQAPATPGLQTSMDSASFSVVIEGNGQYDLSNPSCSSDLEGGFEVLYEGDAIIAEDGFYLSGVSTSEGELKSTRECSLPSVDVEDVQSVWIRAELKATSQNCETFCSAWSRGVAEEECGAVRSAASCRESRELTYEASCSMDCEDVDHVLVAETALSASAIADLNWDALEQGGLSGVQADVVFERIEDGAGNVLCE